VEVEKMITKPSVEELLEKAENRFELVNMVARRSRQIMNGDDAKIDTKEMSKITIAALELVEDKFGLVTEDENKEEIVEE